MCRALIDGGVDRDAHDDYHADYTENLLDMMRQEAIKPWAKFNAGFKRTFSLGADGG